MFKNLIDLLIILVLVGLCYVGYTRYYETMMPTQSWWPILKWTPVLVVPLLIYYFNYIRDFSLLLDDTAILKTQADSTLSKVKTLNDQSIVVLDKLDQLKYQGQLLVNLTKGQVQLAKQMDNQLKDLKNTVLQSKKQIIQTTEAQHQIIKIQYDQLITQLSKHMHLHC